MNREQNENIDVSKPKMKPPRLCQVCERVSFLKCMECDTIYCSSKCQIEDWEVHQYQHISASKKNLSKSLPLPSSQPKPTQRSSVQSRITSIQKVDLNRLEKSPLGTINKTQPLQLPPKTNYKELQPVTTAKIVDHEINEKKTKINNLINQTIDRMQIERKFAYKFPWNEKFQDANGFFKVFITEIVQKYDKSFIYWVVLDDLMNLYKSTRHDSNKAYDSDLSIFIPRDDLEKFKMHLVMVKVEGNWLRCRICNINKDDKCITLEDIDSGKKHITTIRDEKQFKVPMEKEISTFAFASPMLFENVSIANDINVGDIIKIRKTVESTFGEEVAEVEIGVESKPEVDRIFIDNFHSKELQTGDRVKIQYCDCSKLSKGKLHITESQKENWAFYKKLEKEIKEFVENNPPNGNYRPVEREMLLAKYTDGCYYRCFCISLSGDKANILFIDYGSSHIAGFDEILPLPKSLSYPSWSHTVEVKFPTNRPFIDIDVIETYALLESKTEFYVKVEKISKTSSKYAITLDDSLVVYKKT